MNTQSKNCKNAKEFRRLRAVELHEAGYRGTRIAEVLGVTKGAVSQWLKAWREGGKEALMHKFFSKKPSKLTPDQKEQLIEFLKDGPEAQGYEGQIWTQARVRALIQKKFGITYSVNYISSLLKKLRWSWQKPICKASQRDEEEIERWCKETWPAIKKKPKKRGTR